MSATAAIEGELPESERVAVEVEGRFPGRIVLAEPDGTLHLGRSQGIHRSDDGGRSWQLVASMPLDPARRLASRSRLLCRLLRQEVRALTRTAFGGYVASSRQGVFVARPGETRMRSCRVETGDLPLMPPMRLTTGPRGEILWGESGSPETPRPMRLFASHDHGESFEPVRALEGIPHAANVVWDAREQHYWVLAGHLDPEPGIGRLSADLQRFDWFVRGEPRHRAVEVFDLGDRLVYATDTPLGPNALVSLDKSTGKAERLRELGGRCSYACRFGGIHALTTGVEASAASSSQHSELWLSRDAERWRCAWRTRKDRWSAHYFQRGSLVLPSGSTDRELLVFSGQAVQGLDGKTAVARLAPGDDL